MKMIFENILPDLNGENLVWLRESAKILSVVCKENKIYLCYEFLADNSAEQNERYFTINDNGQNVRGHVYIGTVLRANGTITSHVYEVLKPVKNIKN